MRYLTLLLICCLWIASDVSAQLRLEPKGRLDMSADSIANFIRENRIEYGFFAWKSSSGWPAIEDRLYGLLSQNGRWYLTKIVSPGFPGVSELKAVYIRQEEIDRREARILLRDLKIRRAFKYGQDQIDRLPLHVEYVEGDATVTLSGPTHFSYWHILDFSRKRVETLKVYAPEWSLENFLPYEPAFEILRPLVFTHSALISRVKAALPD